MFMYVLSMFHSLTCELDPGLAADQHAVAVLGSAVVLSCVRLVLFSSLGEVPDEQRSVTEHRRPDARRHWNTVPSPGDGDRPLPLYLTVQHQGTVPHRNDIAGLFEKGQLRGSTHTWEQETGQIKTVFLLWPPDTPATGYLSDVTVYLHLRGESETNWSGFFIFTVNWETSKRQTLKINQ